MSEGNNKPAIEGGLVTPFATNHRLLLTFINDDVIPLSLRGQWLLPLNPPTSVVVRHSTETADAIYGIALEDHALKPACPTPMHIDSLGGAESNVWWNFNAKLAYSG